MLSIPFNNATKSHAVGIACPAIYSRLLRAIPRVGVVGHLFVPRPLIGQCIASTSHNAPNGSRVDHCVTSANKDLYVRQHRLHIADNQEYYG